MYLKGVMPFLWKRLFTASEDIPNSWAISTTGIPSIYETNITLRSLLNQVKLLKIRNIRPIFPKNGQNDTVEWSKRYTFGEIYPSKRILRNFFQNLDNPPRRGYIVLMFR
jgi:hypothetical protein